MKISRQAHLQLQPRGFKKLGRALNDNNQGLSAQSTVTGVNLNLFKIFIVFLSFLGLRILYF